MLQIQPSYDQKEAWMDLALQKGLSYEILEFSVQDLNRMPDPQKIEWYKNSGLVRSVHGAFIDNYPLSQNLRIREISREDCEKSCRLAKATGASNVVFHSTALPFVRGGLEKQWGLQAADYYQSLADRYDLCILIENFSDADPEPLSRMMESVRDPRVGICLDAGHAHYSRKKLADWISELGEAIRYLHISDNPGDFDRHMIPGEGSVDFALVHRFLEKQNTDLPITLEVPGIEGVEKTLNYFRQMGYTRLLPEGSPHQS